MSLSLYRVPDGHQEKGQSAPPCPSVYSPAPALGSLSSVALSSVQAAGNLAQTRFQRANYRQFRITIWSGFLREATNSIWSGFLREAIGKYPPIEHGRKPRFLTDGGQLLSARPAIGKQIGANKLLTPITFWHRSSVLFQTIRLISRVTNQRSAS
jgi:hypothetical protein